jgi:hypothetical protein
MLTAGAAGLAAAISALVASLMIALMITAAGVAAALIVLWRARFARGRLVSFPALPAHSALAVLIALPTLIALAAVPAIVTRRRRAVFAAIASIAAFIGVAVLLRRRRRGRVRLVLSARGPVARLRASTAVLISTPGLGSGSRRWRRTVLATAARPVLISRAVLGRDQDS